MVMATEKKATLAVEDAGGAKPCSAPITPTAPTPAASAPSASRRSSASSSLPPSPPPPSPLSTAPSPPPPRPHPPPPLPPLSPSTTQPPPPPPAAPVSPPSSTGRRTRRPPPPRKPPTTPPPSQPPTPPPSRGASPSPGETHRRRRRRRASETLHPSTAPASGGSGPSSTSTRRPAAAPSEPPGTASAPATPSPSKISGFPCNDPNPNPNSTNVDVTRHVQFGKISGGGIDPNLNSSGLAENNDVNASRCARPCNETKRLMESSNINASGGTAKSGAVEAAAGVGKVGRSRSVGCGSRSFSGDFLERISTGLGDCTLRRVESQREGKAAAAAGGGGGGRIVVRRMSVSGPTADDADDRSGQQRARCAGIFGMAMAAAAAPPCPAYWAAAEEDVGSSRGTPRARVRGWGWALASPIRALRSAARGHVEGSQEGGERKGAAAAGRTAGGGGGGGGGAPSALVSVRGW